MAKFGHSFLGSFYDEDDEFYSDDEYLDDDYDDEEEVYRSRREAKIREIIDEAKNNPIPDCQELWGLKGVELKVNPEAWEVIASQVR